MLFLSAHSSFSLVALANPFSLVYAYTEIYLQPAVCTFVWAGLRLLAETKQRRNKDEVKRMKEDILDISKNRRGGDMQR